MTTRLRMCLAALVCLLVVGSVAAQDITRGSITGVVRDPSGGVVPGAKVTLSGPFGARSTTTGAGGEYSFPNLMPSPGYTLSVEQSGFVTQKSAPVAVRVNQAATV